MFGISSIHSVFVVKFMNYCY